MRKIFGLLVLLCLILVGTVLYTDNTNAYFKDNCYAAQWENHVNVKGDFDQTQVYSTKLLCYSNNKLEVKNRPDKTFSVILPKFKNVNDKSVTVEYCEKLVLGVCTKTNDKTFKLSDYNGDFSGMAKAIDSVLSGAAAPSGYKKIAFEKNDAKYSMEDKQGESEDDGEDSEVVEDCANQGGAQSLGWIICPIMSLLGDAAEGLYNSAVEPALNIEPKLFSDSNSNTEDAWGLFRNIANIVFLILMLLVIFSQLTGVGIDNYGIKKILPKLIVVAVLTNLSFVLCALAIDVSNILGNSFQGLFEGMREGLNLNLAFEDGTTFRNQVKSTVGSMVGVGVLSALVGMSGEIWQSPMVALSLLLGAIGVVISIFFLFVLLAAREAAIVVLVVLAPVAMVLYALPNTKKVFDKWLKAFEGLLLVYPIAGLLVGGGNYVSALLIHSGMGSDFFGALTAMIAGVLPIFFIPTMLKGSFSALGTIGARISGFGAGASRGVTRALGNSGVYKNAQESARMWADRNQAGAGDISKMGRFGRFIRGGERGITAARARNIRNVKDYGNRELLASGAGYGAALAGAESENMKQRVAGYESLLAGDNELGEGGSKINANNIDGNGADSLKSFHRDALSEYANASTNEERDTAMAKIRAVQNMMSKTEKGRTAIASNIEQGVMAGGDYANAASSAASHLMSEYGDLYKTKNRGTERMLRDLTGAGDNVTMGEIAKRTADGTYGMTGTDKYTEETLAGADDAALQGLINNLSKMDNEQLQNIQGTASRAIQKSASGNLNVKPEVLNKLNEINNYRRTVDNTGDFIPE